MRKEIEDQLKKEDKTFQEIFFKISLEEKLRSYHNKLVIFSILSLIIGIGLGILASLYLFTH